VYRPASSEAPDHPTAVRRLLLVEDDSMLVRLARRVLAPPGFALEVAGTAEEARRLLAGGAPFDALLLDIELPDQSGLDLLRGLRDAGDRTPVLILTGRDTDEDVVRGLDAGADDYLVKPISAAVLKARLRAAWRRTGDTPSEGVAAVSAVPRNVGVLTLDGLTIDRLARRVTFGGREVDLTPKEFSLLEQLMLRAEDVVSRGELLEHVWQVQGDPGSNVVDAHVARCGRSCAPRRRAPRSRRCAAWASASPPAARDGAAPEAAPGAD
jgi:DNA-binding response OmpR family regulator